MLGNGCRSRFSTHNASSCPSPHWGAQLVPQMRIPGCLYGFVPALRTGPAALSSLPLLLAAFILASAGATYRRPLWSAAGGRFATAGRGAKALGPLTFAPGPADILKVTAPRPAYFEGFTLGGCLPPFVARSGRAGNTSEAWPGCVWGWGGGPASSPPPLAGSR